MATVSVPYIVDDVNSAVAFYTRHLGFGVERQPAPGFAILSRGDLRAPHRRTPGTEHAWQALEITITQLAC